MKLEQAVQIRWTTYRPLVELVPDARLTTGASLEDLDFPYVAITKEGESPEWRSTDGEGLETLLRFSIFDGDLDRARKIAELIKERFDRQDFPVIGGACYVMQWTNNLELSGDDGIWTVLVDYSCRQAA